MGWRLAEEIAWARPERPGPEWWTLLDIAQDARDETRQSMCGTDYLMARGKCSKRTLYRRLEALRTAGLLTVARKSAPGVRAIYEIPAIHEPAVTGVTIAGTRLEANGCQNGHQRVPLSPPTGASVSGTHAVRYAVITTPSLPKLPVADSPVEGSRLSTSEPDGEIRMPTRLEIAALRAVEESRAMRKAAGGMQ